MTGDSVQMYMYFEIASLYMQVTFIVTTPSSIIQYFTKYIRR